MTEEFLFLEGMPWHVIKIVQFFKEKIIIKFRSGSELEATQKDPKKFAEFRKECEEHLDPSQIEEI